MRIREVGDYLTAISPFIEKERTCDGWLFGDPDRELAAMAVAWMGTIAVIEEAGGEKVNLLVVHEPLFYGDKTPDKAIPSTSKPVNLGRRKLLEEYGIVVYRCHDGWDTYPEIGVVDSWAAALGLGERVGGDTGAPVYEVPKIKLGDLAKKVNGIMELDGVRVIGGPDRVVSKVGLGIGAWGGLGIMERLMLGGADVMIVGETIDWKTIRSAVDSGLAMIETSHAPSEKYGVNNLARRLKSVFAPVPVHYIEVGSPWVMVR